MEEHFVLTNEPNSQYVGHITPTSSLAGAIAKSILDHFLSNSIDLAQVRVVICGGTAVNTGKGGVIRFIEKKLQRLYNGMSVCSMIMNYL